jgi:hypothetical protein
MAGKTNLAGMRKKSEEVAEKVAGSYFKAKVGDNLIRILPPWKGENPFYEFGIHGYKKDGKYHSFVCGRACKPSKPCFSCDVVLPSLKESSDAGNKDDGTIFTELQRKNQVACNLLELSSPATLAKLAQIWNFNYFGKYNSILAIFNDPDYGDISDPDTGRNLILTRTGEGLKTEYNDPRPKPNPSAIPNKAEVLASLHDLEDEYQPADEAYQRKCMQEAFGLVFDDGAGGDMASETTEGQDFDEGAGGGEFEEGDPGADEFPGDANPNEEIEGDESREALVLGENLNRAQRAKAIAEAVKNSPCYGTLFNENSGICATCSCVVECADAMEAEAAEPEPPPPIPPKRPAAAPQKAAVATTRTPAKVNTPPARSAVKRTPPPAKGAARRR